MKLQGYRTDGTLRIQVPGGMTVLLRGDVASPPLDDKDADRFGPWLDPEVMLSGQERLTLAKRLDRARTVPAQTFFALQFPFAKKTPEEDAPAAEGEAATAVAAAPAKPLTKGDLLAKIQEIAEAKAKEKEDADKAKAETPPLPRHSSKKLKLEFEVSDREGEEPKEPTKDAAPPVSDVAQATQAGDAASLPAHLRPMEARS